MFFISTTWSSSLLWPAQAASAARSRIELPVGLGQRSLVFKLDLPEHMGGGKLVWRDGYELQISVLVSLAELAGQAAVAPP
jgi:hypothetical protein